MRAIVVAAMVAVGTPAMGLDINGYITTEVFSDWCRSAPDAAFAYAIGVIDTAWLARDASQSVTRMCIPQDVTAAQIEYIACTIVPRNPPAGGGYAANSILHAVMEAFPCN